MQGMSIKLQFNSIKKAIRAMSELPGITAIRMGSAIITDISTKRQRELLAGASKRYGGYTVDGDGEYDIEQLNNLIETNNNKNGENA